MTTNDSHMQLATSRCVTATPSIKRGALAQSLSHVRLCNPMDCSLPASSAHGDTPGKNTGVGCHILLQGIFLTQGSNLRLLGLLHWQAGSLPLAPLGKPPITR